MPDYKDESVTLKGHKLSQFDPGFINQALLDLLASKPAAIRFQDRLTFERMCFYLTYLSKPEVIYLGPGFPYESLLYYSYLSQRPIKNVFCIKTEKEHYETCATLNTLTEDLSKKFNYNYFNNQNECFTSIVKLEKPVLFLFKADGQLDLRPHQDFMSMHEDSVMLVTDYATKYPKNEHLYARRKGLLLLEHADGSADFLSKKINAF